MQRCALVIIERSPPHSGTSFEGCQVDALQVAGIAKGVVRRMSAAQHGDAAKRLGWNEIPVTVVDLDAVVRGEFAENAYRKDFTLSEAVANACRRLGR